MLGTIKYYSIKSKKGIIEDENQRQFMFALEDFDGSESNIAIDVKVNFSPTGDDARKISIFKADAPLVNSQSTETQAQLIANAIPNKSEFEEINQNTVTLSNQQDFQSTVIEEQANQNVLTGWYRSTDKKLLLGVARGLAHKNCESSVDKPDTKALTYIIRFLFILPFLLISPIWIIGVTALYIYCGFAFRKESTLNVLSETGIRLLKERQAKGANSARNREILKQKKIEGVQAEPNKNPKAGAIAKMKEAYETAQKQPVKFDDLIDRSGEGEIRFHAKAEKEKFLRWSNQGYGNKDPNNYDLIFKYLRSQWSLSDRNIIDIKIESQFESLQEPSEEFTADLWILIIRVLFRTGKLIHDPTNNPINNFAKFLGALGGQVPGDNKTDTRNNR